MDFVVDGRAVHAYTGGKPFDATLPCVVFLHGALHDHSVWTLLARWFAHHGHAVLAPDLPAHGRSAGPPLADVEALARWTLALLDAAGVQEAALVGHSMGSLIALEAAAQAPTRARHLAMLGTAYPMAVSPAMLATALSDPLRAIDMVNVFSHSSHASKPSFPGPGAWLHGGNRALMRRMQGGCSEANLFHHEFGICDRYARGAQAAQAVGCGATLVLGEHDQMTAPKQAAAIATALRAEVVRLPTGHNLMAEAPDALLAALRHALVARPG